MIPAVPKDVFDEDVFAPPTTPHMFQQQVEAGLDRLARSRIAVCGLARNLGSVASLAVKRMRFIGSLARDARFCVYENDSKDQTRAVLEGWACEDERVTLLGENIGRRQFPNNRSTRRTRWLATCRNQYLSVIHSAYTDVDFIIILDLDMRRGFSIHGLLTTFSYDNWDVVAANSLIWRKGRWRQYDSWALRPPNHVPPVPHQIAKWWVFRPGESLVPVYSAFGGLAVYRRNAIVDSIRYEGGDCEHVSFHAEIRRAGFDRIFLNPSQFTIFADELSDEQIGDAAQALWTQRTRKKRYQLLLSRTTRMHTA